MNHIKQKWEGIIQKNIRDIASEMGQSLVPDKITLVKPPNTGYGDLSLPLYSLARDFRISPNDLAKKLSGKLGGEEAGVAVTGPYLNIRINRVDMITRLFSDIEKAGSDWVNGEKMRGMRIMIEFSSPNTNKPLHLGHMRNDAIGESCARIMATQGASVHKVNLFNDRGMQICKSMLAYKKFTPGKTPEVLGIKGDKFVGDLYVRFARWAKENPEAEIESRAVLRAWEEGESDTCKLWELLNSWALNGIEATYRRTGVSFDQINRESETYLLGKEEVNRGLEKKVFYRHEDGSVRLDLSEIGLDNKVFIRADGTSVYITQDLGTAVFRYSLWPFDQLIYVVGNEQKYHFNVLFYALKKLGYAWAGKLYHLPYGMVNLPEGKMKSREGTVVDADELIDDLKKITLSEIRQKGREDKLNNVEQTAEKIALAALHYYILQVSPEKDMIFDPGKSISFNGRTGPYLQYSLSRICSLMGKSPMAVKQARVEPELLEREDEWNMICLISEFPAQVYKAAENYDPSIIATSLYEIAKEFNSYYHEVPIAMATPFNLAATRIKLARAVLITMKSGMRMLNIPELDAM